MSCYKYKIFYVFVTVEEKSAVIIQKKKFKIKKSKHTTIKTDQITKEVWKNKEKKTINKNKQSIYKAIRKQLTWG